MSAQAMGWVFRHSPLVGASFLVHLALADSANDQNDYELWFANETLAAKSRVSPKSIERAHHDLLDAGLLELLDAGGGRGRPSRYRLLMPEGAPVVFESSYAKRRQADGVSAEKPRHGVRKPRQGDALTQEIPKTPVGSGELPLALPARNGNSNGQVVRELVGRYVDNFGRVRDGARPAERWITSAGKVAREAIERGVDVEDVRGVLAVIAKEGKNPVTSFEGVLADSLAGVERPRRFQ